MITPTARVVAFASVLVFAFGAIGGGAVALAVVGNTPSKAFAGLLAAAVLVMIGIVAFGALVTPDQSDRDTL
ncbi:hypothetical protein ABT095_15730 [Kitasatospora sp. NPDC002227]|uniref:hypothetical protein n=1 Tax=Kitasatospora sp. NPDC002227 TaxID=3154773 RepID=UPI00332A5C70